MGGLPWSRLPHPRQAGPLSCPSPEGPHLAFPGRFPGCGRGPFSLTEASTHLLYPRPSRGL